MKHEHGGRSSIEPIDGRSLMSSVGIAEGERVLDAGCGDGHLAVLASFMTGPGGVVYAVDVFEKSLETLRREVERRGGRGPRGTRPPYEARGKARRRGVQNGRGRRRSRRPRASHGAPDFPAGDRRACRSLRLRGGKILRTGAEPLCRRFSKALKGEAAPRTRNTAPLFFGKVLPCRSRGPIV